MSHWRFRTSPAAARLAPFRVAGVRRGACPGHHDTRGVARAAARGESLDPPTWGALSPPPRLLVEHLQARIDEAGEGAILF